MAKKRERQPHRVRNEAIVITSQSGQVILPPPLAIKGRVHILPAAGTVIRRLKAELDDRANDGCEGRGK